jgi:hypothetical protein
LVVLVSTNIVESIVASIDVESVGRIHGKAALGSGIKVQFAFSKDTWNFYEIKPV